MIDEQRRQFAVRLMFLTALLVPFLGVVRRMVQPDDFDPMGFRIVFSAALLAVLWHREHPRVKAAFPMIIHAMIWTFAVRCLVVALANGLNVAALLGLATVQAGVVLTIPSLRSAFAIHGFLVAVPIGVGWWHGDPGGIIVRNTMGLVAIAILSLNDVALRESWERVLARRTEALERMRDELEERVVERTDALAHEVSVRTDAERRALAASAAKSQFLANMSHELRTPLNAIQGYAELVKEDLEAGEAPSLDDVARIHRAGGHLLAMIDEVLDLARVEQGHLDLRFARVPLQRVIDDALATVGPLLERAGCAVEVAIEPAAADVVSDPQRLVQILVNLLGNAAKFAPDAPVRLRVDATAERVDLEVCDHGPGIAPEHLDVIFESFAQVDPSSTREVGGTGLGLAISRELARALGGELVARSVVGKGTTFALSLPRTPRGG